MAVATFLSRILGLVREQVLAHSFGASGLTDCFNVAYRIPNMLRDLFAEGAFSSAFVPVFAEENAKDPKAAQKLLWSLFWALGGLTFSLSAVIFFASPWLVKILAPSFTQDPELFSITTGLTKWMAPFLGLVSVAALFMGALNSRKVFFIPALAPACFNLVAILSIACFPQVFESFGYKGIFGLGLGVSLGGIFQLLIQIPQLKKVGLSYLSVGTIFSAPVKKVFWMLGPGLLGYAATQINVLVNTILATGSGVGAVSWLTYAFRLFQFPVGILGVSLGNSNMVHFNESWKEGRREEALILLKSSIHFSYLSMLPATFLFLGMSKPVVNLVFERGLFNIQDTQNTALALSFYALGLPLYGLYKLFTPLFYTIGRPKYLVFCSLSGIGTNIIFSLSFINTLGFSTLALGTTLAMAVNCGLQIFALRGKFQKGWGYFFDQRFLKVFVASFLLWPLSKYLWQHFYLFPSPLLMRVGVLGGMGLVLICFYVLVLFICGEASALRPLVENIKKKLKS